LDLSWAKHLREGAIRAATGSYPPLANPPLLPLAEEGGAQRRMRGSGEGQHQLKY
jgi:hypothetical protein